jgi:hypothetical protein
MDEVISEIENIILHKSSRGMDLIKNSLEKGYTLRAAKLIINNPGTVLIGTGFPAAGSFETDGPIGAVALYNALKTLGYKPVFVFAPPIFNAFKNKFDVFEFPILDWNASVPFVKDALNELSPSLIISIERAGAASDGKYYNMRKKEITELVSKFDLFFKMSDSPTIAIGDGGNEIGMGNVLNHLKGLDIIPSVTQCTELIIATVSNWGAYGIIAALSVLLRRDLFLSFNTFEIMEFIIEQGSVDGINHSSEYTEDGFPIETGQEVIALLKRSADLFLQNKNVLAVN